MQERKGINMSEIPKQVDKNNLPEIWSLVVQSIKLITGDVNMSTDGTLQEQINDLKSGQSSGLTITDDTTGTNYKIGIDNGMLYYEEVV